MPPDTHTSSSEKASDRSKNAAFNLAWEQLDRLQTVVEQKTNEYVEQQAKSKDYLEKQVALLLAIFESVGDAMVVIDQEGAPVLFNEAAAAVTGMHLPDMTLQKWAEQTSIYLPDKETQLSLKELPMYKALQGITTQATLFYRIPKNPGGLWGRVHATPIRDRTGNVHGAVAIFFDASEAKEATERIHDLYNNAPCGYHSVDKDDNIVEINDTELAWLGYGRDEIIGKLKFAEIVAPDCKTIYSDSLRLLTECSPVREVTMQLTCKNGTIMPVLWNGTAVTDDNGDFLMTRSVIFDITERTKLIQQRDNLLAIVTHDLKNHLFGETQLLDMLLEEGSGQLTADQEKSLRLLQANGNRQLQIIDSLMEIYRYETGAETLRFEVTDITAHITQCIDEVLPSLKAAGLTLECTLAKTLPAASVDAKALRHVINNLLGNAVKYTPVGGCIKVESYNLNNNVIVTVADNGQGIPKDELDILFQGTSHDYGSLKPVGSTGLGLYLCRKILDAHSATITCASAIGAGTTFTMTLPGRQST